MPTPTTPSEPGRSTRHRPYRVTASQPRRGHATLAVVGLLVHSTSAGDAFNDPTTTRRPCYRRWRGRDDHSRPHRQPQCPGVCSPLSFTFLLSVEGSHAKASTPPHKRLTMDKPPIFTPMPQMRGRSIRDFKFRSAFSFWYHSYSAFTKRENVARSRRIAR